LGYPPTTIEAHLTIMPGLPLIEYVEGVREQLPPLCSVNDGFFLYGEGCWSLVHEGRMLRKVQERLPTPLRAARPVREVAASLNILCQIDPDSLRGAVTLLNDRVLINMADGVLGVSPTSIATGPHDHSYMFTKRLAIKWDDTSECPSYMRCLEESLPDLEDRNLFKWFMGYILYPSCRHNVFLVAYGPRGGEGKSTLIDSAAAVLGPELVGRASLGQLCNPSGYHIPLLKGFLVNIGSELNAGELGEADNLKIVCGGGDVAVREIFGKPFVMRGYSTKLLFASNHLPRFRGGSGAEARRLRLIYFGKRHAPDPGLTDRLVTEKEGIFRHIFLPSLQAILGGAPCPPTGKTSSAISARFGIENDPHSAFVSECCEFGDSYTCQKSHMITAWRQFVDRNHLPEALAKSTMVYRRVTELDPKVYTTRPSAASVQGKRGKRPTQFVGVRLKGEIQMEASTLLAEMLQGE
jgi:phage/plasmid-associated DNA primase